MSDHDETRADGAAASSAQRGRPHAGMMVTERVRLRRPLEDGGMGSVWIAEHLTLGSDVAVKFVRGAADASAAQRLTREAQIAARLVSPHAVRVFDHGVTPAGTPFIVMELLEGETLTERIEREGPLGLGDVRALVAQMASVLTEAHALGIAHRDIKPHNIFLLRATPSLFSKLLDFGLAKPFAEDVASGLTAEGAVVGTPLYMAPEQLIDGDAPSESADLWGLTVVAYQALTGRRPFAGRTRAAVGVAMLLGRHERVSVLAPTAPKTLDDWFRRNLSLEQEDRCATVKELAETFDQAITGAAAVTLPPPARPGRLHLPERIDGRQAEVRALVSAFERAAAGRARLVMIAGYAGIGKTALVTEAEPALERRGATFAGGKFDEFDRGTPYASLVQAFRGLALRLLRDPEQTLWRDRILDGVGENLAALTDVIDELEELVGPQPALAPTSPGEARSRFLHTVRRFVGALATPERPLALFLDDLQWADLPSLDSVASLATDPTCRHVLLVGTCRHNEVDARHPLARMLARVREGGGVIDEIVLGPLDEDAVLDLVSDVTDNAPGKMRLAVECHAKTRGNAFFLRRFLESLNEGGLLCFDADSHAWTWDIDAIRALPMTNDIVDFVVDEMRRMDEPERGALGVAACIGARFDIASLAYALGTDWNAAMRVLRSALEAELVVPETRGSWQRGSLQSPTDHFWLCFAHDRIRQAARSLVTEEEAAAIHARIGRYMLEHLDAAERDRRIFEVVEHLNRGPDASASSTGKLELRTLNLRAARRATASAAFEPAWRFYREALARVSPMGWTRDYDETLAIHVEGARAAYLSGDHEAMETLIDAAVAHASTLVDRVSAEEVRVQALVSQERFDEAFALAYEVLAELGIALPVAPATADVEAAVGRSLAAIAGRGEGAILELSPCDRPEVLAALRIQQELMSAAYLVQPELVPILTSNMVVATVEHGLARESPYGFAVLALVLNAANLIDECARIGALARGLLDRLDDRTVRPSTLHVLACYVTAWTHPLRESIVEERRVFEIGMDVGDLEYAGWGLHVGLLNSLYAGVSLDVILESGARDVDLLRYHRQLPPLSCTLPILGAAATLRGTDAALGDPAAGAGDDDGEDDDVDADATATATTTTTPTTTTTTTATTTTATATATATATTATATAPNHHTADPPFDEAAHLASLEAVGFRGGICVTESCGALVRFVLGDLDGAIARAERAIAHFDGAIATYNGVVARQILALATLAQHAPGTTEVAALEARVAPHLAQLRIWRAASEENHAHRIHLVEAELARIAGRTDAAAALYARAIAHAHRERFVYDEGIAHELAARLHTDLGDRARAREHLAAARAAYDAWGARAKCAALDARLAPADLAVE